MPNKAQFIEMLAERLDGDRKRAAAALDAVIDSVYAAVARGEKVAITGFGVFERRDRAARTARNPATGAPVKVAASRVPAFRPGTEFEDDATGGQAADGEAAAAVEGAAGEKKGEAKKAPHFFLLFFFFFFFFVCFLLFFFLFYVGCSWSSSVGR